MRRGRAGRGAFTASANLQGEQNVKQAAIIAALMALAVGPAAAQDAAAGKQVFGKCTVCHVADSSTNKLGPHLADVIGRVAGSLPDYNYSKAMKDAGAGGLVWDKPTLSEYLVAPKKKVPGTKMVFAGLKKPEDIQNLLAYLESLAGQ
jgi:cytochrome c